MGNFVENGQQYAFAFVYLIPCVENLRRNTLVPNVKEIRQIVSKDISHVRDAASGK